MEGVSSRLGRASSRYGGSAPVFTGPVRKWKKQWVHVSSVSHSRSHNTNAPSLLLCKWTPLPTSTHNKPHQDLPPRKFRYSPIVVVDDLKKEVEKRGKEEAVTSRTSQSSPRETGKKDGIFRKQDIDSLFMEVSQASRNDQDDNSDGEEQ